LPATLVGQNRDLSRIDTIPAAARLG